MILLLLAWAIVSLAIVKVALQVATKITGCLLTALFWIFVACVIIGGFVLIL